MTTLQEYLDNKYPTKEDKEGVRTINRRDLFGEVDTAIVLRDFFETLSKRKLGIRESSEEKMEEKAEERLDLSEYVGLEILDVDCSFQAPRVKLILGNNPKLNTLSYKNNQLTSLDLSGCTDLTKIDCSKNQLTSLDLSGCTNLTELNCFENNLTSIDFLKQLPNPEKLEVLEIFDNNIQPTTLDFLRPFVNLKDCRLGENVSKNKKKLQKRIQAKTYNKFHGSLESTKNLTKLEKFCIAGTDVEEGLEYIPTRIAQLSSQAVKEGKNAMMENLIDCQSLRENDKVAKIQDQLRPFNYDIEAWQLAHPKEMLKNRPELFTQEDSREKWINALADKIAQTQQELQETKTNLPEKVKIIQRLEDKLINLEKIIKTLLEQNESLKITKDQLEKGLQKEQKTRQKELKDLTTIITEKERKENIKFSEVENLVQELKRQTRELEAKKDTAYLEKELTETKQNHQSQLRNLATILFPSNSDISNISFTDLKMQTKKVKEKETKTQELEKQLNELNNIIFPNQELNFSNLKTEIQNLKVKDLVPQLRTKKKQLEQFITNLRQQAGDNLEKVLELYYETYTSMLKQKKENDNFFRGQLVVLEKVLVEKLTKEDLQTFAKCQKEVVELERQLEIFALQEEKYKTGIEISSYNIK